MQETETNIEATISLCKIKEANLSFMAFILQSSQDYLDDEYTNAKGFVRNTPDGCYEIIAEIYEY